MLVITMAGRHRSYIKVPLPAIGAQGSEIESGTRALGHDKIGAGAVAVERGNSFLRTGNRDRLELP